MYIDIFAWNTNILLILFYTILKVVEVLRYLHSNLNTFVQINYKDLPISFGGADNRAVLSLCLDVNRDDDAVEWSQRLYLRNLEMVLWYFWYKIPLGLCFKILIKYVS